MSLFGSIFGDSKDVDASQAPMKLANISEALLNETSHLRRSLIDRYTGFVGGGSPSPMTQANRDELNFLTRLRDAGDTVIPAPLQNEGNLHMVGDPNYFAPRVIPALTPAQTERLNALQSLSQQPSPSPATPANDITSLPQFASLKDAIDRQFSVAKNNILATTTPGGAMTSALGNLEGVRASTKVSGISNLYDQEMARAFALGTGTTPTALGGLGSAAGALGNIGMAQAAQQAQAMSGLGYGIGSSMGRKGASSGSKGGATTVMEYAG